MTKSDTLYQLIEKSTLTTPEVNVLIALMADFDGDDALVIQEPAKSSTPHPR